ncbi:unnamed protein product [Brassica rapa subsp. trilocularis]
MDKESATPSGAASNAIKATAHLKEVVNREPRDDLEKHKKDITEKKTPDVIEMLKGLVDRLERMEEKVDHRLREIEEKVDMLISSVSLNNELVAASMKTGSVKAAEADNMSVDESSSDDDDEEESVQRNYRANTKKATTTSVGPFVRGRGYGPTSLNVGGPFSGGRCGGRGECSFC